jgi:hypothetical protein
MNIDSTKKSINIHNQNWFNIVQAANVTTHFACLQLKPIEGSSEKVNKIKF